MPGTLLRIALPIVSGIRAAVAGTSGTTEQVIGVIFDRRPRFVLLEPARCDRISLQQRSEDDARRKAPHLERGIGTAGEVLRERIDCRACAAVSPCAGLFSYHQSGDEAPDHGAIILR